MASIRSDGRRRYAKRALVCSLLLLLFLLLAWWAVLVDETSLQDTETTVHAGTYTYSTDEFEDPPVDGATTYETSLELPEASRELVEEYRDRGDCLVQESGYIDLLGNTWSLVVEGPGWVDLCVVSEADGKDGSLVRVQRLEASQAMREADA